MAEMTDQSQKGGENSLNLQAAGNISYGLSFTESRRMFMDLWESNFPILRAEATATAKKRVEEYTDEFLKKLSEQKPDAIKHFADPDLQTVLLESQKAYARSGNKDLGEILTDLMVERAANDKRDLYQIVLNESLAVAPKLTPAQWDTLSVIYGIRYCRYSFPNSQVLRFAFNKTFGPLYTSLPAVSEFVTSR